MPPPHLLYTKPSAPLPLSLLSSLFASPFAPNFPPCLTYGILLPSLNEAVPSFVCGLCPPPSPPFFSFPSAGSLLSRPPCLFTPLSTFCHWVDLEQRKLLHNNWIVLNINTDSTLTLNHSTLAEVLTLPNDFNLCRSNRILLWSQRNSHF